MSNIIEHKHIEEILPYINALDNKQETLVLFDIDDVLINPQGSFGGYRWWEKQLARLQEEGRSLEKALAHLDNFFVKIQPHLNYRFIESTTFSVFTSIQKTGISLMGLTGRTTNSATTTRKDLSKLGIHFTSPLAGKEQIINNHPASFGYIDGIIYCNGLCKGNAIHEVLARAEYKPKQIIFIDDVLKNLTAVQESLQKMHPDIAFTGIHYTHAAHFISFNPAQADLELQDIQQKTNGQISL